MESNGSATPDRNTSKAGGHRGNRSTSSLMQHENQTGDLNCGSCVRLLKEILDQPESRPRILLQALMGKYYNNNSHTASSSNHNKSTASCTFRPMSDGVEVLIPMEEAPKLNPRRWTKLHAQNARSDSPPLVNLPGLVQLATSPSSIDSDQSATQPSNKPNHIESIKIQCRPCNDVGPEANARAMIMGPTPLSIVACTNRLKADKDEIEQVLTHELVHAYDIQQLQLDFTDCESMAYSEVRAAREAECHKRWSFMKEYCINQKAIAATNNLFPQRGRQCVRKVLEKGMEDKRPFNSYK